MTVRVLEDGTRVYSNFVKYTPVPLEERKYAVRKPDIEGAVRWKGDWLLPLPLLADDARDMPETRPDTDAFDHVSKPRPCRCLVCARPEAQRWIQRGRRALKRAQTSPRR